MIRVKHSTYLRHMGRIIHGRSGRRTTPARPASFQASQPPQQSLQSPFGSVDPNTVNGNTAMPLPSSGFNFGQPNGGSSQTFPQNITSAMPANSQSTSFGGFGSGSDTSTGFNAQASASTSNFNFSVGGRVPQNNPFTRASNSSPTTSTPSGYQGSIFNLPSSNPVLQPQNSLFQEHEDTEDHLFASHAPFLEQNNPNNPNNQNTPNNQLAISQPTSSVFNQAPNQQQQTPTLSNTFGQSNLQPTSNIFGSLTSQQLGKQPTSNIFGQSRPQQTQATSNIFGSLASQPQQAQPSSNIFGQFSSQSSQPKTSFFGQNITTESKSQPDNNTPAQFGDSMQTSPDNSPQKIDQPKQGVFSFLNSQPQTQSDKTNTIPGQGRSLFDRITQPASTPAASTAGGQGGTSNTDQHSGPSPSKPTGSATQKKANSSSEHPNVFGKSTANDPAFSSSTPTSSTASTKEAEKGAIGNRPFATPNLGKPSIPDPTVAKSNPFAGLKVPSLPQSMQPSQKPTTPALASSKVPNNPGDTGFKIKGISANSSLPASNEKREMAITSSPSLRSVGTPPTVPAHFTEVQKQQMVTGYRLRSLDIGLKKYMLGSGFFSEPLLITRFYEEKKQEIVAAQGLPKEGLAGTKRKAASDETDLEGNGPPKKTRSETSFFGSPSEDTPQTPLVPSTATNGTTANTPIFAKPTLDFLVRMGTKRAAEEYIVKENANDINGAGKKARCDDNVSYPSLPATSQPLQASETSNIFKSILSKPDNESSMLTPSLNGTSHAGSSAPKLSAQSLKSSATSTVSNILSTNSHSYSASSSTFQASPAPPLSSPETASSYLSQSKPTLPSSDATDRTTMFSSPCQFKPSSNQTLSGSAPINPFTIKPATPAAASFETVKAPSFKLPTFGTGAPVNFLAQFGKAAEENAKKEKEKRKAIDFDSDEDDEAEWERKDAEEQRAKKQKLAEAAKGKVAMFVPGKGFVLAEEKTDSPQTIQPAASAPPSFQFDMSKPAPITAAGLSGFGTLTSSTGSDTSIFSNVKSSGAQNAMSKNNIFGHLSDAESGAERSQAGDADDEDTDSGADSKGVDGEDANEGADDQNRSTQPTDSVPKSSLEGPENAGGNNAPKCGPSPHGALAKGYSCIDKLWQSPTPKTKLLERVASDKNDRTKSLFKLSSAIVPGDFTPQSSPGHVITSSSSNQAFTSPASSSFGQSSPKTVVTSPFDVSGSPVGDHTWKQDSPIKFSGIGSTAGFSVTPATPTKPAFTEQKGSPSSGFGGLFGAAKPATHDASSKPATNFFGAGTSANKSPNAGVGFAFGGPPKSAANILAPPSGLTSNATSRATSPGATTGGESANDSTAEGAEGETEHHEQVDLAAGGPGEENEDILFEVRAKALMYDSEKKKWPIQGLGPLRVLKDRKTGKTRILLRQDPSGRIVLNAALMTAMSYDYSKPRGVKLGVATDNGKLSTWMIKVGKDDDATGLSSVLESNKSN